MKLTSRQVFDKYRSLGVMVKTKEEYTYKIGQVCGYHEGQLIIGFKGDYGLVKEFARKPEVFDNGCPVDSYWLYSVDELKFIDNHATERLNH